MDLHTWIYVISILCYLYYFTQVFDRLKMLLLEKSKISEPKSYKSKERSEWRLKIDAIIRRISVLKKKNILFFFNNSNRRDYCSLNYWRIRIEPPITHHDFLSNFSIQSSHFTSRSKRKKVESN